MRALLRTLCGCSRGVGVPDPPPLDWFIPIKKNRSTIADMRIEGISSSKVGFYNRRFVLYEERDGVAYYQEWQGPS